MSEDKLVKAKAGVSATGAEVELEVGNQVPGLLASMLSSVFPTTALRSNTRKMVAAHIFGRLRDGQIPDDADLEYLDSLLKPNEAKWFRQKAILQRAAQIAQQSPPMAVLPPHEPNGGKTTSDDWRAKFLDDAGLVSEETLREIYAQVLVSEDKMPGSCSLRTLKVVRYLDTETAKLFAKVVPLIWGMASLPQEAKLLEDYGITHNDLLDLDDAELLHVTPVYKKIEAPADYYSWGDYMLRIESKTTFPLPVYPLTRAGQELYRVAQVERDPKYLGRLARWIKQRSLRDGQLGDRVRVLSAPHPRDPSLSAEALAQLSWTPVEAN